jgi:hypothetical protein
MSLKNCSLSLARVHLLAADLLGSLLEREPTLVLDEVEHAVLAFRRENTPKAK